MASQAVARRRALTRAAKAWQAGKPHQAWEILLQAGLEDHWRQFQRTAFRLARGRYLARIERYKA